MAEKPSVQRMRVALSPARSRDFALLWLGQGVSQFGTNAGWIAWIWLLTDLTRSTTLISIVLTAGTVPTILLTIIGGALVDRGDPRRFALWSEILNAVLGFALAVLVALHLITIPAFLVYVVAVGAVQSFADPALSALFPATVEPDEFNAANSLRQTTLQLAMILGPPLGGFLIARWSLSAALAFDAITFMLAALTILLINRRIMCRTHRCVAMKEQGDRAKSRASRRKPGADDFLGGIRFLLSEPPMLAVIIFFSLTNAINNVEAVLVPILARSYLRMSAAQYGLLVTFLGAGSLLGAVAMGVLGSRVRRHAVTICGSMTIFGMTIVAMGLAQNAVDLYVAYALFGLSFVIPELISVTLWQHIVPSDLRGRVFGMLSTIALATNPIGFLVAGVIGEILGVRAGLVLGGAAIVGLSVIAILIPTVRRLDQLALTSSGEYRV